MLFWQTLPGSERELTPKCGSPYESMKSRRKFLTTVLSGLVVWVLVYILWTSKDGKQRCFIDNRQEHKFLETWGQNTRATKTMLGREHSHKINQEKRHVIASLRQQLARLRNKLAKAKKNCHEPVAMKKPIRREEERAEQNAKDFQRIQQIYNHKEVFELPNTGENSRVDVLRKNKAYPFLTDRWKSFRSFTETSLYDVNVETYPIVTFTEENLYHGKYQHLNLAMKEAIKLLQKFLNLADSEYLVLKRGLFYEDSNIGVEYEFQFLVGRNLDFYNVRLIRPYSSLTLIQMPARVLSSKKLVNILVPLAGRINRFREFMKNFLEICVLKKENVFLTVVYYGKENISQAKRLLQEIQERHGFLDFHLIHRNREFNRGQALHDGVKQWKGDPKVLLFFCDVDVQFDSGFLERCRSFSEPGRQVYYPIVFNLYNPKYVAKTSSQFMKISGETGFWRYYGYGMTCQHRNDYFRSGGFDRKIKGWGIEDGKLFQKYLHLAHIRVIRAPDSGLFHHYHEKNCDRKLPSQNRRRCVASKIDTEASKAQFGRRVFELEARVRSKGLQARGRNNEGGKSTVG